MVPWRIALSEQAELDLEGVTAFLARKNVSAAERIGLEIVEVIFSLATLPARGAPMRGRPGLRKVVHRHYVVIYRLRETQHRVEIIRIWDGRLDPTQLTLP
ncbi:MAG: type II toxin-antitoxin system RelE/ParE family toxin [Verrucomicrobia bacterium]|nr:type II toxin-antitoxin system RelE/ParE family toxin [Verrucomicrobiota bacterium]